MKDAMKSPARLLTVTNLAEVPVGLVLLMAPSSVTNLLLGVTLDSPAAQMVARVAGAAVSSLGLACGLVAKDAGSRAARGLIGAMSLYNILIIALFTYAAMGLGMTGIGLWPAVAIHAILFVWCIVCLRATRQT